MSDEPLYSDPAEASDVGLVNDSETSSDGVEKLVYTENAIGSNPTSPTGP